VLKKPNLALNFWKKDSCSLLQSLISVLYTFCALCLTVFDLWAVKIGC